MKTIRLQSDGTPFTCYTKAKLTFRKGKHWKPCTTELAIMKKKLDKLASGYEQVNALGQKVKAKRMLQKAVQLSKRISELLKLGGQRVLN